MTTVSVVVPTYNRSRRIAECLASVARQSFSDLECLVIDDGSTDDTVSIAQARARDDARFRVVSNGEGRRGASARRNQALQLASGDYVVFLDSDDLLHETCLAGRVETMESRPDCDFVVFPVECFRDAPGDTPLAWNLDKPVPDLMRFLRQDVPWCITSPMWRREAVLRFGGFDESLPSWQDWQLHVAALLGGARYDRSGSRSDAFIRLGGADNIGRRATTPGHQLAKLNHALEIGRAHAARLAADEALREAYVGLVWDRAVAVQDAGRTTAAIAGWSRMARRGLIAPKLWREGVAALALHGRPGGGLAWRSIRNWPDAVARGVDRATLKNTPVRGLQGG